MDLSNRNTPGSGGSNTTLIYIIIAALVIIAGGFLIGTLSPQLMPKESSTQAEQVDQLFKFLLTLAGIVFLLVQGVLAFSVIRFRARKGDTGDGPAIHGNTTLEFVWTAVPALTVLAITI